MQKESFSTDYDVKQIIDDSPTTSHTATYVTIEQPCICHPKANKFVYLRGMMTQNDNWEYACTSCGNVKTISRKQIISKVTEEIRNPVNQQTAISDKKLKQKSLPVSHKNPEVKKKSRDIYIKIIYTPSPGSGHRR